MILKVSDHPSFTSRTPLLSWNFWFVFVLSHVFLSPHPPSQSVSFPSQLRQVPAETALKYSK